MADLPWMKFYPSDWRSDPRLRMCGLAARGLWIEMIGLMHEADPYGHLLVSGLCPTEAQLAVLVGAPPDQIPELIGELESAGVFSRTRAGVIFSRRMTRTAKKRAIAQKNGQKGGNPTLGKGRDIQASDKGQDKGGLNTQRPEARGQSISVPSEPQAKPPGQGPPFSAFWLRWPSKQNKAAAEKAFAKLRPDDRALAVNNAAEWFLAWRKANPDARDIHAATYLNNRRWIDDFGSGQRSSASSERIGRYERMGR